MIVNLMSPIVWMINHDQYIAIIHPYIQISSDLFPTLAKSSGKPSWTPHATVLANRLPPN